jgi:protocatechuate 3,4-dioxygenase beta subunit
MRDDEPEAVPFPSISRRHALRGLGVGVAVVPWVGCGANEPALTGADAGLLDASTTPDAGTALADASAGALDAAVADAAAGGVWASGGTALMSGAYRNPFEGDVPTTCIATCAMTKGPCHSSSPERRDVSEGYPGLPVRLALRICDDSCAPVAGANVEIWHTRNSGLYSGTNDNGEFNTSFCTGDDADAQAHKYFRGLQTTDAEGVVLFETCFPGWYPGRAIHIHFKVMLGADSYLVSQVFFPEDLTQTIFESHPDYVEFGQPDTANARDSVLRAARAEDYMLSYERQSDGAMLAWRTIFIRSDLSKAGC